VILVDIMRIIFGAKDQTPFEFVAHEFLEFLVYGNLYKMVDDFITE